MKKLFVLLLLIAAIAISCKKTQVDNDVQPTITDIFPLSGKTNDPITITGTNFSTTVAENVVSFNGINATIVYSTGTVMLVKVPEGLVTGAITVKVLEKNALANPGVNTNFTAIIPANITLMQPTSGTTGDEITLTGTNFSANAAENIVSFNGIVANVKTATATSLTVTVPIGVTTGLVTVKINNVDATVSSSQPGSPVNFFTSIGAANYGTPGQAYSLPGSSYSSIAKAYDNDGNLWVVDNGGKINRISYTGGTPLKTIATSAFNSLAGTAIASYSCASLARDANGAIHAYINYQGGNGFMVATVSTPTPVKDFDVQLGKTSSLFSMVYVNNNLFMISAQGTTHDIIRLKPDGTSELYIKGDNWVTNPLIVTDAYRLSTDGTNLYVLTYLAGQTNTLAAVYKFDSNKNRTLVATLTDGGYTDGPLASAKFNNVSDIAVNGSVIYVADNGNKRIRKIDTGTNTVSTVAGNGLTGTTYNGNALNVNIVPLGLLVDDAHKVLYSFGSTSITRLPY